uniref:Uncharacterized mitochondrial protein AtMg00810-like n=1 Tax=Tanacetum cinerariifolium TaxID=118510 RepID=A0A6L2KM25_TANCI|nr:uncharacterized mitochondrial protein AtMg00810-like [Tanacetum cinerariifolium]
MRKRMRFRCYYSSDQSFSTSFDTTCCSRKVGSTTLKDKVIVTLSNLNELITGSGNALSILFPTASSSKSMELCTAFENLIKDKFQMSSMWELTFFLGLQVTQKEDGIFISQDKYVHEILKKFNYSDMKSTSTRVDLEKPLVRYGDTNDVDVHLYRSIIGSLMYLTAYRPNIMFVVCACARFQFTLKTSHLLVVKRIFRYLKGKLTLGFLYPRDSPFELVAYTDSDYAGATQDRKSTTEGCQFLGNRLISWQCKKQTVVPTSTTEAKYVVAASCYGQVLWIQNQLLDYSPLGNSKEVGTLRYLSLVVPLIKVGDEAVHKKLGDRTERAATATSSLEAERDSGSEGFHQILDFLNSTHIKYALTANPIIYVSLIHQFWETASTSTLKDGKMKIITTIDGRIKTITEASIRRHLKLEDSDGITTLPNIEIFEQLALMGYVSDADRLTFNKGHFSS